MLATCSLVATPSERWPIQPTEAWGQCQLDVSRKRSVSAPVPRAELLNTLNARPGAPLAQRNNQGHQSEPPREGFFNLRLSFMSLVG